MSVLATPRIYFRGEIAWDPIVTNNVSTDYDENTGETVLPQAKDQVKAFRQQAIAEVLTGGNWNPHGTHRSNFYNTTVTGFDLGDGLKTADPFVSAAVNFNGMLVDLEPYGSISSQLFFDTLHFGVDGGYRILAPRTSRMIARYINFTRNTANTMIAGVASVVWQTSFSKADGLRIDPFDSPTLKHLAEAIQPDDVLGLTVRFNVYRTIYFDNPELRNGSAGTKAAAQALNAKLNGGGFQPNPARSLLVGVLGLWRKGEPAQEPGDRSLNPLGNSPLGAAHARVEGDTLTLDLSNSVPEVDNDLKKMDLGELTVVSVNPATQVASPLGSFGYRHYNRAGYEGSAGLVSIALPPGTAPTLATRDLQLRDATGAPLLAELRLRGIPTTPNLYLDEGDQVTASFQVYDRGRPAASSLPVTLFQLDANGVMIGSTQIATDPHGLLTIPLIAQTGQVTAYVPSFGTVDQPQGGVDPQVNTYMYVRVRPADSDVAALSPTWENVYARVLANWNAMAPCMDNWLKLDDPAQVLAYAAIVKRLTDPANFEGYRFMPVTRDMSGGERTLLYNFLQTAPGEIAAGPAAAAPRRLSVARLSRAMRRR